MYPFLYLPPKKCERPTVKLQGDVSRSKKKKAETKQQVVYK